jgi:hypothetical protein
VNSKALTGKGSSTFLEAFVTVTHLQTHCVRHYVQCFLCQAG